MIKEIVRITSFFTTFAIFLLAIFFIIASLEHWPAVLNNSLIVIFAITMVVFSSVASIFLIYEKRYLAALISTTFAMAFYFLVSFIYI